MVPDAALSFSKEIERIGKAVDITASWVVNVQLKPCADNSSQMSIEGIPSSVPAASSQGNLQDKSHMADQAFFSHTCTYVPSARFLAMNSKEYPRIKSNNMAAIIWLPRRKRPKKDCPFCVDMQSSHFQLHDGFIIKCSNPGVALQNRSVGGTPNPVNI